jgi:hypothetical protein
MLLRQSTMPVLDVAVLRICRRKPFLSQLKLRPLEKVRLPGESLAPSVVKWASREGKTACTI